MYKKYNSLTVNQLIQRVQQEHIKYNGNCCFIFLCLMKNKKSILPILFIQIL
jgi:hypothetical protein